MDAACGVVHGRGGVETELSINPLSRFERVAACWRPSILRLQSYGHLHGDLAVRRVALDLEVGEGGC